MSVSREQKIDIINSTYKSVCCRRALLNGVLFSKGSANGKVVQISLERQEYADFVLKLVKEFFGKDGDSFRTHSGGRRVLISFESPSASKYISSLLYNDDFSVCDILTQRCASCLSSFLRGVFLACGRLSDPTKQFSLEFSIGDRCDMLVKILSDLELNSNVRNNGIKSIVYFHKADQIEDFYGYAGINKVVFDIIEVKINSLARRESQRYLNCVTSNYDKMAAVSKRQIGIISRLDELQLLSSLPEELEETARLKLRYPDLPLSALAAQMTPAISKSGLSHRLKKIEEVGAKLLKLTDD